MRRLADILTVLFLCLAVCAQAQTEDEEVQPDCPGMGTGTTVLDRGHIQWESSFGYGYLGMHILSLPYTLFRFGLSPWAELRLEYEGALYIETDDPDSKFSPGEQTKMYIPSPLVIGTKVKIIGDELVGERKWIPRISAMAGIGLPLTKSEAERMPFSPSIDLLFEHDATSWLNIGYTVGAHWLEWAPAPDIFASLAFNFDVTDKLTLFVESYNYFDCDNDPAMRGFGTAYDINLDFGFSYLVHPRVQLDASASINCYQSEPTLSGPKNNASVDLGVAWLLWYPR